MALAKSGGSASPLVTTRRSDVSDDGSVTAPTNTPSIDGTKCSTETRSVAMTSER